MRSELTEPTLEELSAYIDGELDETSRERVEQHLAACADCRTRVDGLREATYAIRALPMESPPRSFSIPKQRTRSWSWAPVGWLGAAAASVLVIAVGLHFASSGGGTPTSSTAFAPASAPKNVTAGAGAPGPAGLSQAVQSYDRAAYPNGAAVVAAPNQSHGVVLGSDEASYRVDGTMRVSVLLEGSPISTTDPSRQGLTLRLMRAGVGVVLESPIGSPSSNGPINFAGSYAIQSLQLPDPKPGEYQLMATWVIPDGSGRVLEATIPIHLMS